MKEKQGVLFSAEEMNRIEKGNLWNQPTGPVTVLGMTFENDEERRKYFRDELRKRLPELRKIEGFPIGEDDDIVNLSDPPYYTACPNPWLNDFVAEWEKEKKQLEREGKRKTDFEVKEPYASDVSEGKNNPIYMAHSYHTKVPHPAIMRYILHYTQPGDIVLDGFCGTGMTGVACNLCGNKNEVNTLNSDHTNGVRHGICIDLSPYATHIASGYNNKLNKQQFERDAYSILQEAENKYSWMYRTKISGKEGKVLYYIWSEVFCCPQCGHKVNLWKNATEDSGKIIKEQFECPNCGCTITKKTLKRNLISSYDKVLDEVVSTSDFSIVRVNYILNGKRTECDASEDDIELFNRISMEDITNAKAYLLPEGVKSRGNQNMGIIYAHQLFTYRNLVILDYIYKRVYENPVLFSWFTSALINLSKMWKFKPDRKGGNLNGTLYVPSLSIEQNPIEVLRRKVTAFSSIFYNERGNSIISTQSALDLSSIKNNSIDYIFVDPPFGANIMYSELNSLGESWLRVSTNNKTEAIVDQTTQRKSLFDYQTLMTQSFKEFYRVLKPSKWLTIEFSNTSASVWNSIQNSLQSIGFVVSNVSSIDKQQGSFNAVTTTTAVKQDLVITCYKPSDELTDKLALSSSNKDSVWDFLSEHLAHLPVHIERGNATTTVIERSPKILYDRLISYYVQHGYQIPMDAQEFQTGLRERFIERDGMYFTAPQAADYEEKRKHTSEFVPMGLIVSDEANGIEWLKLQLIEPKTYQEISPEWMQAVKGLRKGDVLPELKDILEENFIEDETGHWHVPDLEKQIDLERLKHKSLMKEFNLYKEMVQKPRARIKEVRVEALREGFKQCFKDKDFATILLVGDKIPQNILTEDEQLLQYYDIAQMRA